jgi:hypothetical protein
MPADDVNQRAMATSSQYNSNFSAPRSADNGLFANGRESVIGARAELATRASAFSPFAPNITATKSHTPPGSANPGDTLTYTIVITNSGTDATGVNFTDTIDPNTTLVGGSVKASPIAVDDAYHTIGNVNISVPVGQGVTANDSNSGTGTLSVTKVNATVVPPLGSATTSTANGSVTMNSDGSFTYTPNVAFRGPSDTFTYELDNGSGSTDTATVTISVNGLIWFVNAGAAPGGDGRLSTPFNCLVGAGCFDPAAADIANDNIFVYSGSYTGGLTLLNNQRLIGQGAGDTLINITALTQPSGTNLLPSTGGANPAISAAGADVTVASGNTIRGVTLNGTSSAAIDLTGSAFGTLSVAETTLGGTGKALNLNSGTLSGPVAATAAFQSISSTNSSTTGISLTSVAGTMSSGSTTITNPTGIGISVSTSSGALDFGTTTSTASGGTGVSLTTNTGTITFGSLTITPDSGQRGLLATDNTLTITSNGGAISTTGATAVEITRTAGTTPLVMSLTSVAANGGTNGIRLSNTSGSFTVTGDGASDPANTTRGRTTAKQGGGTITLGSGGTINNTSGPAVSLSNTTNVTLRNSSLTGNSGGVNSGADGVNASSSSGLTLDNVLVTGHLGNDGVSCSAVSGLSLLHTDVHTNATTAGTEALDIWNVRLDNLTGTSAVTNSLCFDSRENIFFIMNSGTSNLTLTVTNSEFRDTSATSAGNVGFGITASGSAVTNVTATGSTFSNVRTTGFQYAGNNTSSGTVNVRNSVFEQNGVDVDIAHQGAGTTLNYEVSGNTMRQTFKANSSVSVNIFLGGLSTATSVMSGTVKNNVIGNTLVPNSGSDLGAGIQINPSGAGTLTASVTGNNVTQVRGSSSSVFVDIINDTAKHNLFIHSNTFAGNPAEPFGVAGLEMDNGTGTPGENGIFCLDMASNTVTMSATSFASVYLANFSGTTNVVGYTGTTDDETQLGNFFGDSPVSTPPGVNTLTSPPPTVFVIGGTVQGSGSCSVVFPMSVGHELSIQSAGRKNADAGEEPVPANDNSLRSTWGKAATKDSVQQLTQEELNWMVQAALQRWQQTSISAEDMAKLSAVTFEVADLGDDRLSSASSNRVRIDQTAAGYGWFYDQSPLEDSEFDVPVPDRELQTTELSPAHGKIDLLTVLMRELGAVYLSGKNRVPRNLRPLMNSTLSPAVRRMPVFNLPQRSASIVRPDRGQVATAPSPRVNFGVAPIPAVFHTSASLTPGLNGQSAKRIDYATIARRVGALNPFSGETVTLSIGTIPAGKSVTIMFQVTVNTPFPNGVCNVTNQGHVTGSNFSQVDTNSDVAPINSALTIGACPANITTSTDAGVCTAVVTYTSPTAAACPAPTVTCNPASGSAFNKGTTTVTCTASNGSSPDQSCSFTVTVNDTEPPTVTCPSPITANTDPGLCTAVVTYATPAGHDNCPGVTVNCSPTSGSTFNKGVTTVICTATDAASLTGTCSFTVTVVDNQSPTIGACPSPIITNTAPGMCSAVVTYATPSASDNCPGVTVGCSPSSGSVFLKGTTTVTCTATDTSSHTASCSFTVTVVDNQPPSITCPGNVNTTEDSPGSGCATVTYTTPTPSDNCPGATANCSPASGTCFPIGTTTVTCTATDTSFNTSACQFTVTVTAIGLTDLSPAKVWIGLKNSDDVGTKFDLLAEVLKNGSVVGSGQLNDVPGGSSGFNNAVLRTITLALSSPVAMGPGDTMSFRLSVRIAATSGHNMGTARLWYNGAAIDSGASRDAGSRFDATIAGSTSNYFLRSPSFTLNTTAGSSRVSVDKTVSNSGGNPFVAFGTWSKTF